MERLTRKKDGFECRIANGCPLYDWVLECIDGEIIHNLCDTCPVMAYINKLAKYEDLEEKRLEFQELLDKIQRGEA